MNLREIFECARDNAKEIFQAEGEMNPVWHIITGDDQSVLIPTPWRSDAEKEITVDALRQLFKEQRVKRLVFVCEAWIVEANIERAMRDDMRDMPRPSEHPDRREVLHVTAEDRNGKTLSGHYYILRPEHGPPTLSPFHEDPPDVATTGRLTRMLMAAGEGWRPT